MASPENLEKTANRIRNLPQYRGKSEEELLILAELLIQKKERKAKEKSTGVRKQPTVENIRSVIDVESLFSEELEKKLAKDLLTRYLTEFELQNISDKALLKELIYLEVFQRTRLQKSAEELQKEAGSVPLQILDSIHKNIDKIVYLKTTLGLSKEKNQDQNDAYKALQTLIKKAEIWRRENQASRMLYCPHCVKPIMLRIRTEAWEAQAHPFFRDRILGNSHLIYLYKNNKLTKEDLAKIFQTSTDYIDWLCQKWDKL